MAGFIPSSGVSSNSDSVDLTVYKSPGESNSPVSWARARVCTAPVYVYSRSVYSRAVSGRRGAERPNYSGPHENTYETRERRRAAVVEEEEEVGRKQK